jgi:ATP-dependent DNA helicase DinG
MYLLPVDGKGFSNESSEQYQEYVADTVINALRGSGGGALILFTSKKMMRIVYERAKEALVDELELMCQDDSSSKSILLNKFKSNIDSSLFATSSFWEGVDAPGETLRLVVIVKLPFTVPTEPINMAREAFLNKESPNSAFMKLSLPSAIIKLKQGIGRLIRSEDDKGVVLLLDNRILSKGYGRMMMSSLPPGYCPEDSTKSNIPDKIERFLF